MPAPVELVAAVLDAVRPRDEHLPAARRAHLVGAVAVEHLAAADRVRPKPAADLDDDRALVPVRELELLAGTGSRRSLPGLRVQVHGAGLGRRPATANDQEPIATATIAAERVDGGQLDAGVQRAGRRRTRRCRTRAGRRRSRRPRLRREWP